MSSKRIAAVVALFLVFAVTQLYINIGVAGPTGESPAVSSPQQLTAILTTKGNKPISVNGASAITGATILSGAALETADASATITIPGLGTLDIAPNTKLTLEFEKGKIKVTLIQGCVVLHTKKGTAGEVDTSQGVAGTSDSKNKGVLDVCFPKGAAAPIVKVAAAGAGGLFGLGAAATVAIIGGGAAAIIIPLATRGRNPSPGSP
jgi:hypothetical protein